MALTDNFTRANSLTIGNGWVERNASTGQIFNNKLRCSGGGSFVNNVVEAPASADFQDGTVSVEFVMNTTSVPQIVVRLSGTGSTYTGYVFFWNGGSMTLRRVVNNASTDLASGAAAVNTTDTYRLTVTMVGNNKTATIRNVTTGVNLRTLTNNTDSAVPGSGKIGVSIHSTGQIDYDNFVSTPAGAVKDVAVNKQSLILTESQASITKAKNINVLASSLIITTMAASLGLAKEVNAGTQPLAIITNNPSISKAKSVNVNKRSLVITTNKATITKSSASSIYANTQNLAITVNNANISKVKDVNIGITQLNVTTYKAAVQKSISVKVYGLTASSYITQNGLGLKSDINIGIVRVLSDIDAESSSVTSYLTQSGIGEKSTISATITLINSGIKI